MTERLEKSPSSSRNIDWRLAPAFFLRTRSPTLSCAPSCFPHLPQALPRDLLVS